MTRREALKRIVGGTAAAAAGGAAMKSAPAEAPVVNAAGEQLYDVYALEPNRPLYKPGDKAFRSGPPRMWAIEGPSETRGLKHLVRVAPGDVVPGVHGIEHAGMHFCQDVASERPELRFGNRESAVAVLTWLRYAHGGEDGPQPGDQFMQYEVVPA